MKIQLKVACLIWISLCFHSLLAAPQPQDKYLVSVTVKNGLQTGRAFLRYFTDRGMILDSTRFELGHFKFTGTVPEKLTIAKLFVLERDQTDPSPGNSCEIWLEAGSIVVITTGGLANVRYSGSAQQEQFSFLQESLMPLKKWNADLDRQYDSAVLHNDESLREKLIQADYPALFEAKQKILGNFITGHPSSLISAYKFDEFAGEGQMNLAIVEPVYEKLDETIKRHPLVEKVAKRIAICKQTRPGQRALEFSQTDTSGKLVQLSSFRGKYVLIDFWAGWCVPCRAENPHLIRLYKKYKKKGFEILGVSLDGERERWTNAIVIDQLVWPQVSDLQIFDNKVAQLYGINSIPQNILVDPDGYIVEWNLRGAQLDKKLAGIFR